MSNCVNLLKGIKLSRLHGYNLPLLGPINILQGLERQRRSQVSLAGGADRIPGGG